MYKVGENYHLLKFVIKNVKKHMLPVVYFSSTERKPSCLTH